MEESDREVTVQVGMVELVRTRPEKDLGKKLQKRVFWALKTSSLKLEEERKRPHASEIMNSDAKTAPVIERNVEC